MKSITIEKFVSQTVAANKGMSEDQLRSSCISALKAKKAGAKCDCCGRPVWAAGWAITGTQYCFTCTTGEANDSQDYELKG